MDSIVLMVWRLKSINHDPEDSLSLPENEIRSLFFDKVTNGLLVGTAKGLAKFDHKANSFVRYHILEGKQLSDNMTLRAILRDINKHLWVASSEGLFLQKYGSSDFQNIKYDGLDIDPWSLLANEDGSIWVGTSTGLLNVSFSESENLSIQNPQDSFPFLEELASLRVGAMKSDREGNLWLGTESNGLFLWNTVEATIRRFPIAKNSKTAISYEAVRAINIDNTGRNLGWHPQRLKYSESQ